MLFESIFYFFIYDQDMNLLRAEKKWEKLLVRFAVRDDEPIPKLSNGLLLFFSAIDFDRHRIEQLNQQKLSRCQKVIFMVAPRRFVESVFHCS